MLHSPTALSLEDLITAPEKAEFLLELLTPDQILAIEQTLGKVKRRRLDKKEESAVNTKVRPNKIVPASSSTTTTTTLKQPTCSTNNSSTPNEPTTEMRDGIEWVSFVYSHNRTLKRYSIRTDLQKVDITDIDDKFKSENCVSSIVFFFFPIPFHCKSSIGLIIE
jgi:hypothetical protein